MSEHQVKWSHSSLKDYEGCARRYHEVKVLKKYPFQQTDATRYGVQVHEALEHYIKDGKPIPPQYAQFQPVVDAMLRKTDSGRVLAEYEMALTKDLRVCKWDAPTVWVRGIADILIVDDDNLTAWVGRLEDRGQPLPRPRPVGADVDHDLRTLPTHPQSQQRVAVHCQG